ncbi:purine-cytosine permease family protein [Peribacillus sp. NPDC096540]|uniref:purine-cytosine permease family protein n=1 Tax=Peribacillus sp. NPDC096540 TaxID=3390612 RepID=UPI003D0547D0
MLPPIRLVTRAMFGIRGNRIFNGAVYWACTIFYLVLNLAVGSLAGFALAKQFGLSLSLEVKVTIFAILAVSTLAICIYGQALIMRISPIFTAALAICIGLLGVFVLKNADFSYVPSHPPQGGELFKAVSIGFTIIAACPMSWPIGADYARYLPTDTPRLGIIGWIFAGGFLPTVLIAVIGSIAATKIDMSDPQTSIASIVPSWFYPLFLLVIVIGSIYVGVLSLYSGSLYLQGMGVRFNRIRCVFINGTLAVGIAIYVLLYSSLITTLNNILQFSVILLGPLLAIYATDIILRQNHYDGLELHDETPSSQYWYYRGFNLAGVGAYLIAVIFAFLCMNTVVWKGAISNALEGVDLSGLVGPVVASIAYLLLWKKRSPS